MFRQNIVSFNSVQRGNWIKVIESQPSVFLTENIFLEDVAQSDYFEFFERTAVPFVTEDGRVIANWKYQEIGVYKYFPNGSVHEREELQDRLDDPAVAELNQLMIDNGLRCFIKTQLGNLTPKLEGDTILNKLLTNG